MLLLYAVYRTWRPINLDRSTRTLLEILLEVGMHTLVVIGTGYWDSPYVFSLITAIIVAGFVSGIGLALRISFASIAAVALPFALEAAVGTDRALRSTAEWAAVLFLVAAVSGYARRLSGEAEERHSLALDRLGRLAEANTLLYSLHQVAQTLPASLDLDEVLDSTVSRLDDLFEHTALAILLHDDSTSEWLVARAEGVRAAVVLPDGVLPATLHRAIRGAGAIVASYPRSLGDRGLSPLARSALYAPLRARGNLVGLIALEHHQKERYGQRDVELLNGFVDPVALAVDNARWFSRLRTVGADEERTRIARDLHDRVGQSLAYVAFELDRIARLPGVEGVTDDLARLRQDLRTVIGEVRETLYDLRTDVSDTQDLPTTINAFLRRVEERSDLRTEVQVTEGPHSRLPLLQEREMWRIAQEAITNAERHSGATMLRVIWQQEAGGAVLEVSDNGRGVEIGKAGRMDSYGILGMRERAASIGAQLEIDSTPGRGTTVRCVLT